MLAARNAINWLGLTLGLLEAQTQQVKFHPQQFDIGELPIPAKALKAYGTPRKVADVDLMVVHITAVTGGFGVSRKSIDIWDAAVAAGILQKRFPMLLAQLQQAFAVDGMGNGWGAGDTKLSHDLLVRRLAMWERFRSTPYHEIATRAGDVLANRAVEQKSWHANGGNIGAGLALDMGPGEKMTDTFVITAQHAMRQLDFRMRVDGNPNRQIIVAPHRAFSKGRRRDPGAGPWAEVVIPVVEANPQLAVDYELFRDSGLPVPRSWDQRALFDDKGKRIR